MIRTFRSLIFTSSDSANKKKYLVMMSRISLFSREVSSHPLFLPIHPSRKDRFRGNKIDREDEVRKHREREEMLLSEG